MKRSHLLIAIAVGAIAVSASAERVLTLVEPVGIEVYYSGDQTIRWQRTGDSWEGTDTLLIELSDDAGGSWTTITPDATASNDSYPWTVDGRTPGALYRMRITCNQEPGATDTSANFRIGILEFWVNDADITNDVYCTAPGNAANDGTTAATPMLRIQDLVDTYILVGGDTVYVDTGTYALTLNITINPADSGTSSDPVLFLGSTHADGSTVDRGDTGSSSAAAFDLNASYIRLEGLRVTGGYYGVRVDGAGGEVDACEVYANRHGVCVVGSGTVSGCQVHDNLDRGIYAYRPSQVTITDNTVQGNGGHGIFGSDPGGATITGNRVQGSGGTGIYSYLYYGVATITDNVVQDNGDDGIYVFASHSSQTVRNNLVTGSGSQGLELRLDFSGARVTAVNNTIADTGSHGVYFYRQSSGQSLLFKNNVVHTDGAGLVCFYAESSLVGTLDFNTYYATGGAGVGYDAGDRRPTLGEWRASTGQDANSLNNDPLFVDAGGGDYHIASTAGSWHGGTWAADLVSSPAIDAGDPGDGVGAETAPNGGQINQGAYGGDIEASRTPTDRILTLLEPWGGEVYFSGGQTIRWQRTGTSWTGAETVHVEYSDDGGGSWNTLQASVAASDDACPWNVDPLPGGVFYRIRVTCNEDPPATDTSDDFRVGFGLGFYVNDGEIANDDYCSAAGSALNDGVTPGTPKDSVQDILDTYNLEGGDTVYIDTGSYVLTANITVNVADGGTSSNPVLFVGTRHADGSTIDRGDTGSSSAAVFDLNASYIRLEGLRVTGGNYGVRVDAGGGEVDTCEAYANRHGVYVRGSGTVSGCQVHDNLDRGIFADHSGQVTITDNIVQYNIGTGIYSMYPNGATITGNRVQGSGGTGILSYIDDGQATITDNVVQDNGDDGIYVYVWGSPQTVRNNLVTGNGSQGLELRLAYSGASVTAVNNTVADNGSHGVYFSRYLSGQSLTFKNNIVHADGAGLVCFAAGSSLVGTLDYNTYYATGGAGVGYHTGETRPTLGEWRASTGQDGNSLDSDPLFVNPVGGDCHISSTAGSWHGGTWAADLVSSPAIDAGDPGDSVGAETAPNGGRINQGAYGGTVQASRTPAERVLTLLAPVGGEWWRSGDQTIRWQRTGTGWTCAETLHIEYSDDAGGSWHTIHLNAAACDDSFVWNVDGLPGGALYQIRITCNEDSSATDTSGNFRVGNLSFYVNDVDTTNDVYCTAPGNDANDGLTPATPKATVQAILDTHDLNAGDTVFIDTGQYVLAANVTVAVADGGGAGDPVTFVGTTHADGSTIDRGDTASSSAVAFDLNASYVRLERLRVTVGYYGVKVDGAGGEVDTCEVYGNRHGVYVGGSGTVSGCQVHDNLDRGIFAYRPTQVTITDNIVQDNGGSGIHGDDPGGATITGNRVQRSGGTGIYSFLNSGQATITDNDVQDNGGDGIHVYAYNSSQEVRNNLVTGSGSQGLELRLHYSGASVTAVNNTVADSGSHGVYFYRYNTGQSLTFKNNIVHASGLGNVCFYAESSLVGTRDYNTYYATGGAGVGYNAGDRRPTLGEWRASTGQDGNSLNNTPIFVSPGTGDYHLSSTAGSWHGGTWTADGVSSPAIDAGDPGDSVADETAPNGGRINQGAYGGGLEASRTPTERILTLIEPQGGEVYFSGGQTIRWQRTGTSWTGAETVHVEYSDDGGGSWNTIQASVAASDDDCPWNVDALPGGVFYRIRVTCNEDPLATDTSDDFRVGFGLEFYVNDGDITNDFYCSAPGNAGNDGLTSATPKDSVQDILDTYNLEGGDTVYIDTGSYAPAANITVNIADGGTSSNPVLFVGSTHADGSTVDRGDTGSSSAAVFDLNASYIRLEGLRVTGGYYGVKVDGAGGEVDTCEVYWNRHGVYVGDRGSGTVSGSQVYDNLDRGIFAYRPTQVTITDNIVEDNDGTGIYGDDPDGATITGNRVQGSGGTGIYSFLNSGQATITDNDVQDNAGDGIHVYAYNSSQEVRNNLVTGSGSQGLELRLHYSGASVTAVNNTVADNASHGVYFYRYSTGQSLTFKNNIVWANGNGLVCFYVDSSLVGTLDYNTYYATGGAGVGYHAADYRPTLAEWRASTGQDTASLDSDPLFVDAGGGDYHLSSTAGSWHDGTWDADPVSSPAIDAGDPADPIGEETEPHGDRINQGAYGGTVQASRTPATLVLDFGSSVAVCGETLVVPIRIRSAIGVDAFGMTLQFNQDNLSYVGASRGAACTDWATVGGIETGPGEVEVAGLAGSGTPVDDDGELVLVSFDCIECPSMSTLTLTDLLYDVALAHTLPGTGRCELNPTAAFETDVTMGYTPLTVHFTDLSDPGSASIDTWEWDLDGDGFVDSYEQHPDYEYDTTGIYEVTLTVTTSVGSDTSEPLTIQVADPLIIQPLLNLWHYVGDTAQFSLNHTGGLAPFGYQWWFDGGDKAPVPIPGNTNVLTIEPVGLDDAGDYWCDVDDQMALYTSNTPSLMVAPHLEIVECPEEATIPIGGSYTFAVVAEGGFTPLTYEWRKDEVPIPGAITSSYVISPIGEVDLGVYTAQVSDANSYVLVCPPAWLIQGSGLPAAGIGALLALSAAVAIAGACAARRRHPRP